MTTHLLNKQLLILFTCITFFAPLKALSQNEMKCNSGPSLHLNENYDTTVLIISAQNYDIKALYKIITPVLSDYKVPQIIIFDRDGKARALQNGLNPNLQAKWSTNVTIFQDAVVWSQDFFEAFSSKEGSAFIRLVKGYKKDGPQFKDYTDAQLHLTEKLRELGITNQQPINIGERPAKNGHKGGNIESTNEGFCLIGDADLQDSEWNEIANQNCGGATKAIKLPTSWLPANHVDELIKQLPSQSSDVCEAKFAIIDIRINKAT